MKTILVILFFLISSAASSQIPIEDAIKLRIMIDMNNGEFPGGKVNEVNAILKLYTKGSIDVIQEKNPFLSKYCSAIQQILYEDNIGTNTMPANKAINTGSLIIDGLARFVVNRMKQELQAAFFERLYTFLKNDKYKDCRTLLPNSYETLLSAGDQIYNYETYLTSLRNSFGKDLEVILPNLENVIRYGQYAAAFNANPELKSICLSALFISKNLRNGEHVGSVLENFPATDPDYIPTAGTTELNFGFVHTIQFVQELSKSFKSSNPGTDRYWIDNASLDKLRDPITLDLYLGLLFERVKAIKFGNGESENYKELLEKASGHIDQLRRLVYAVTDNLKNCENKFTAVKASQTAENYLAYVYAISSLLNEIKSSQPFNALTGLNPGLQTKIDNIWKVLGKVPMAVDNALGIYAHLKEKKYTLVISDVRNLYRLRFDLEKIPAANNSDKKNLESIFDFLFNYGNALAEMAEAKDSKEVYASIDRIAAPVGSSKVKKNNVFSVSLNAYGGAFIGKEKIENVKDDSRANNYGISAPIGLAFSFGKMKYGKEGSTEGNKSVTLFLSIIDIGAPVSFRFQNDTLNEIPTVAWKDIVAPGISLIYDFGKVPLSLAAGWQTGPNLRKVTSQYNDYANSKYSRFTLGFFVDIPVFILARRKYWK